MIGSLDDSKTKFWKFHQLNFYLAELAEWLLTEAVAWLKRLDLDPWSIHLFQPKFNFDRFFGFVLELLMHVDPYRCMLNMYNTFWEKSWLYILKNRQNIDIDILFRGRRQGRQPLIYMYIYVYIYI